MQGKLRQASVYIGPIDGSWGTDGEAALERFQREDQLQKEAAAASLGLNPTALVAANASGCSAARGPSPSGLGKRRAGALGPLGFYNGPC